jgi:hypothetical protein
MYLGSSRSWRNGLITIAAIFIGGGMLVGASCVGCINYARTHRIQFAVKPK